MKTEKEKEEESSSSEEEPEQEKEEETSSSEEEQEMDDDEPDPWKPLREKVGEDMRESYLKEVQQFLDIGENPRLCRDSRFQCPITCK